MKQILIVENDPLIAQSMKRLLSGAGYGVATAATGLEAIATVEKAPPDLVLMDINLDGEIDGISTARVIKRSHVMPVVYITQYTDKHIFLAAKETFPTHYITKPFDETELLLNIELALNNNEAVQVSETDSIFSRVDDGVFICTAKSEYEKLRYEDILFLEANGAYTHIYYKRKTDKTRSKYTISMSSNHAIEKLRYAKMARVHRSFYVNIDKIEKIKGSEIFIDGHSITLSADCKDEFFTNKITRIKK